jgi:hypothetical protein
LLLAAELSIGVDDVSGVGMFGVKSLLFLCLQAASRRAATTKGSLNSLQAWQVARVLEVTSGSSSSSESSSSSSPRKGSQVSTTA